MTYVEPIRGNPITPRNRINLYYTGGGGRAKPLSNAYFYYGEIDKDPIDNPIRVTTKDENDVHTVLPQPIQTNASGCFINSAGEPIEIFTDQLENSILIKDKNGKTIYGPLNEYDLFDIVPYLEKVAGLVSSDFANLRAGKTIGGEMVGHKPGQLWYTLGQDQELDGRGNFGIVRAGKLDVDQPPTRYKLSNDLHIEMHPREEVFFSNTYHDATNGKTVNGCTIPFEVGQIWVFFGFAQAHDGRGSHCVVTAGPSSDNQPFIFKIDDTKYLRLTDAKRDQIARTRDELKKGENVNGELVDFQEDQYWQFLGVDNALDNDGNWGLVKAGTAPPNDDSTIQLNSRYYLQMAAQPHEPFGLWHPDRVYKTGDIVKTITNNQIQYWEWYSNVEFKAGIDPTQPQNRFIGWTDKTRPWYWVPFVGQIHGMEFFSHVDKNEYAVKLVGQMLISAQYWRLKELYGVKGNAFNLGDVKNRFIRVSNDAPGQTKGIARGDTMQSVSGGGGGGVNNRTIFDTGQRAAFRKNSPEAPFSQMLLPHGPYFTKTFSASTPGFPYGVKMNINGVGGSNGGRRSSETRPSLIYKNYFVVF